MIKSCSCNPFLGRFSCLFKTSRLQQLRLFVAPCIHRRQCLLQASCSASSRGHGALNFHVAEIRSRTTSALQILHSLTQALSKLDTIFTYIHRLFPGNPRARTLAVDSLIFTYTGSLQALSGLSSSHCSAQLAVRPMAAQPPRASSSSHGSGTVVVRRNRDSIGAASVKSRCGLGPKKQAAQRAPQRARPKLFFATQHRIAVPGQEARGPF